MPTSYRWNSVLLVVFVLLRDLTYFELMFENMDKSKPESSLKTIIGLQRAYKSTFNCRETEIVFTEQGLGDDCEIRLRVNSGLKMCMGRLGPMSSRIAASMIGIPVAMILIALDGCCGPEGL